MIKKLLGLKVKLLAENQAKINGVTIDLFIGSSSRCAYRYQENGHDLIVKVDRIRWDPKKECSQTKNEIVLWKKMDDEDRVHFVQLISWGKTTGSQKVAFVAQPFLKEDLSKLPSAEDVAKVHEILEKYGTSDIDLDWDENWEFDTFNCLIHEGRAKIYDWGCGSYGGF